jgi:adenine-specific DNA-methyltransferase
VHPVRRRLLVEELVRRRSPDEERRYAASQRAGRIDPNPHQIDAVIFALARIPEGGAILADEVGLGKTIEAGLVIAQLRAEGAKKILLVTPKPLLGQWREELWSLFGLTVREVAQASSDAFEGEGLFAVGRELAGTKPIAGRIAKAGPWDLCVIDEAHEHFAAIYKRYDAAGFEREDSPHAKTAGTIREALGATPVLLLTATPIQNSLAELWGLVQYVDKTGTLLGDLPTFRALFTASARDGGDRRLADGAAPELRRRLAQVVQRTLRRQAQPFLEKPFVGRRARTFEHEMSADERALYDDVTRYLLSPNLQAFRGSHRALLLLGFHRRMASSKAALAASLRNVETRLERMLRGGDDGTETMRGFFADLDDDEIAERLAEEERDDGNVDADAVREELSKVRSLRERAEGLADDSKARALISAVRLVLDRGRSGKGSGKLVLFTESLTTQEYVRGLLIESGLVTDQEITVFRGSNDHPRAREALRRWEDEVESITNGNERPSREVATRLALVHELRTRSKIFLGTEAAAKGLNLQFCDTLVNYDLPWNPQRIEQRIGRVHRYGQTKDVTVINFLAKDNEAQRLTYDILARKLELFGSVLGVSDEVLHAAGQGPSDAVLSALGDDFEKSLGQIYRQARSIEEIEARLKELRDATEDRRRRFEEEQERTASLIESRLDARVREVFATLRERLPITLAEFDADLEAVVRAYLDAHAVRHVREVHDGTVVLAIEGAEVLPKSCRAGVRVTVGAPRPEHEPLHLAHPLVLEATHDARELVPSTRRGVIVATDRLPEGARGSLRLVKIEHGLVETLRAFGALEGRDGVQVLEADEARTLLDTVVADAEVEAFGDDREALLTELLDETLFSDRAEVDARLGPRFDGIGERLERYVEDKLLLLRRERAELLADRAEAERAWDDAPHADARTKAEAKMKKLDARLEALDVRAAQLEAREEPTYRAQHEALHARRYAPPTVTTILDLDFRCVRPTRDA